MTDKELCTSVESIQELMKELNTFVNSEKNPDFVKTVLLHIKEMVHLINTETPFTSNCNIWIGSVGRIMGAELDIKHEVTTVLPEKTDDDSTDECECCNNDPDRTYKQACADNRMYRRYTAKKNVKTRKIPIGDSNKHE